MSLCATRSARLDDPTQLTGWYRHDAGDAQCSNLAFDIKMQKFLEVYACKGYQNDRQGKQNLNS